MGKKYRHEYFAQSNRLRSRAYLKAATRQAQKSAEETPSHSRPAPEKPIAALSGVIVMATEEEQG